ncbi:MAG: ABC transporter permease [Saprospiraceae bacterium]|nr:ABC transporter permease [Saprospiraceae bacterium]
MLRNYFNISLRNLWKHKTFSLINLVGLSLAFATSLLLFLTSYQEFTYNHVHQNMDHIYRYYLKVNRAEETNFGSTVPAPVKDALLADYKKEIKHISRIRDISFVVKYKDKTISEGAVAVDADYAKMFSFDFIEGSAETALSDLSNIVLREDVAKKIFGDEPAMGKIIMAEIGDNPVPLKVSGITAKLPDNTNIENDMMIRYEINPDYIANKDNWNNSSSSLYVQVNDGITHSELEKSLKSFGPKYYKDAIEQVKKEGGKPDENGDIISAKMLPFDKEHFDRNIGGRGAMSIIYPYTLLIISIFIIFIACINFVNLSISRSILRAREVGIRKALGAIRGQVMGQFWGEALVTCLISLMLGILFFKLSITGFNALFNTTLSFQLLYNLNILGIVGLVFLLITFVAGGYPAWFISKVNTIEVLKGKLKTSSGSGLLRKTLIVKQFTISVLLISCTFIIWSQLQYLRTKPLGLDQNHVISVPVGREVEGSRMLTLLKSKLSGHPNIINITAADNNIGYGKDNSSSKSQFGIMHEGKMVNTNGLFVDFEYLKTMGIALKEGRDFSANFPSDSTKACIINESMAKVLGSKDLIDKKIELNEGKVIVGIIKDYHFESLKNNIEPITLMINGFPYTHIFIKIADKNVDATLAAIETSYREIAPNSEYLGSFLDENRNEQYRAERRFTQMFIYAAILAIFLSCLGLFAIAVINITDRFKEIGIRKVLGSSIAGLIWELSKDFMVLVLISIFIAAPFAYYFMEQWLSDFAYRIDIQWWFFALSGFTALVIAFCTISFHAIRAALMNPVKSLRSE